MWNLDDTATYSRVLRIELPWARTWADTREGHTDFDKRERIRAIAAATLEFPRPEARKWAIRIQVRKKGGRPFDIENVPKPIVDAFCQRQIERDNSPYTQVGLYPDDRIDHLAMLQVSGDRTCGPDVTIVEVFAQVALGIADPSPEGYPSAQSSRPG